METSDLLLALLGTPPADPAPLPDVMRGEARMLIDGRLVMAIDGRLMSNVNPSDGTVIGQVADATIADAALAVDAARRAFDHTAWSTDVELRRRSLRQLRDALQDNADEFRAALIAEIGCARRMTYADQYDYAVSKLGFFDEVLEHFEWSRSLPADTFPDAQVTKRVDKVALGVVVAITPWNLPLELILAKVGGALAAGCTMVIKPSPLAPWAGTILGRIIAESTEIPAGVVNIVTSSDVEVAAYLTRAPGVDAVAFTGSTQTGKAVMAAAADGLKRVSLELGGKSACIVLDDADIAAILPVIAGMACFNAGQSCIMPSRILVPRSTYDDAVTAAASGIEAVRVGDPRAFDTFMGPLISEQQRTRVETMLEQATAQGGEIVVGGGRPQELASGFFMAPTLVARQPLDARLLHEEVFGPVVSIVPYDDVDDAVSIANSTEFGLAGYVWSGSPERAADVAVRLRAGMLGVNGGMFTSADMPFGGMKSSGMGREWGVEGLEEFLDTRTLAVRLPA